MTCKGVSKETPFTCHCTTTISSPHDDDDADAHLHHRLCIIYTLTLWRSPLGSQHRLHHHHHHLIASSSAKVFLLQCAFICCLLSTCLLGSAARGQSSAMVSLTLIICKRTRSDFLYLWAFLSACKVGERERANDRLAFSHFMLPLLAIHTILSL